MTGLSLMLGMKVVLDSSLQYTCDAFVKNDWFDSGGCERWQSQRSRPRLTALRDPSRAQLSYSWENKRMA